jgi:nitrite reductase/ring-hydroxylating ferredoxin subunit
MAIGKPGDLQLRGDGVSAEEEWIPVLAGDALPEGKPVRGTAAGEDVFLYRVGDDIFALGNRCTHQGGPLHRGRVTGYGTLTTVTCPIHGSVFRVDDGSVLRGPAVLPQPVYEARLNEGMIELRPRQ